MELRLVILSIACISCLIPSALSFNLVAAKAVASQAAQDIAGIKADTIAAKKAAVVKAASDIADIAASGIARKGQVLKTAATSIAGAIINGAASIGATLAKAGVNIVAAKFGIVRPSVVLEPSIVYKPPVLQKPIVEEREPVFLVPAQQPPVSSVPVALPTPFNIPPPPVFKSNSFRKSAPVFEYLEPAIPPYTYEIVETPRVFHGPVIERFQLGKR